MRQWLRSLFNRPHGRMSIKVWWTERDGLVVPDRIRASDTNDQWVYASLQPTGFNYSYISCLIGDERIVHAFKPLTFAEVWAGIADNLGISADLM